MILKNALKVPGIRLSSLVPMLASGFLIMQTPANFSVPVFHPKTQVPDVVPVRLTGEDLLIQRRIRVEHILVALDEVAEVTAQMDPEQSSRVEPVLADLADQALLLAGEEAIARASTDNDLVKLERTVDSLVTTIDHMVEPEMTL